MSGIRRDFVKYDTLIKDRFGQQGKRKKKKMFNFIIESTSVDAHMRMQLTKTTICIPFTYIK
jgi:hypothetical protein